VRFTAGAGFSLVGNWFNTVAVAVLLFHLTGRASAVAFSLTLQVLPGMFLAPLGGAIADRFERRRLLIILDSARALIALMPLLVHDASSIWIIYLSLLLLQTCTSIYNPAQNAYLPEVVSDGLLEPANATYTSLRNIAIFVGPALAGLVIARWGTPVAFVVNAVSFAVAASSLLSLPRARSATMRELKPRALFGGYFSIAGRYPTIARLSLCYLAGYLPISFFEGTMVAHTRVLGQPASFVGLIYAAAGVGGITGGLLMGQYFRRLTFTQIVIIDLLSVPSLGLLVFIDNVPLFLLAVALTQVASNAGDVAYTTCVQRYVSSAERGRVFGLFRWSSSSGQFIGAGLGTIIATSMTVPALFWVSLAALPIAFVGVAPFLVRQEPVGLSASTAGAAPEGT
jgi:predicted MFS family arabinose efflux permease